MNLGLTCLIHIDRREGFPTLTRCDNTGQAAGQGDEKSPAAVLRSEDLEHGAFVREPQGNRMLGETLFESVRKFIPFTANRLGRRRVKREITNRTPRMAIIERNIDLSFPGIQQ